LLVYLGSSCTKNLHEQRSVLLTWPWLKPIATMSLTTLSSDTC
jgi:hypothetical protein